MRVIATSENFLEKSWQKTSRAFDNKGGTDGGVVQKMRQGDAMCLVQLLLFALVGVGCSGEELTTYYVPAAERCEQSPRPVSEVREAHATLDSERVTAVDDVSDVVDVSEEAPQPPLVDINTATSEQLQVLPGVGPAVAQRIIDFRERRRFRRARDVMRVRGIGPATYAKIRDLIRVR